MCACVCMHMFAMVHGACGCQRTTIGSWFLSCTLLRQGLYCFCCCTHYSKLASHITPGMLRYVPLHLAFYIGYRGQNHIRLCGKCFPMLSHLPRPLFSSLSSTLQKTSIHTYIHIYNFMLKIFYISAYIIQSCSYRLWSCSSISPVGK